MLSSRAEILGIGGYRARFASQPDDLDATRDLRSVCFGTGQTDDDPFDRSCSHVLIEDTRSGDLVCAFRVLMLASGAEVVRSYSAQFYELSGLAKFSGPMIEIGRFCIHPDQKDPDILRLAWGALTCLVDKGDVKMLFGCSSFVGTDVAPYLDAFAVLKHRYLGPERWRPGIKVQNAFHFGAKVQHPHDLKRGMLDIPALLRSYLMMGGWVSDHAVVDIQINTIHVFTGLELRPITAKRQRLLRALGG